MKVDYTHTLPYLYDPAGHDRQPILPFDLVHPDANDLRIAVDGYLDTGCSRSLFDGRLALAIGLGPTRGRSLTYTSTTGRRNLRLRRARRDFS